MWSNVVGIPGDRLHIEDGRAGEQCVFRDEPYAAFEPAADNVLSDAFPVDVYDFRIDPDWWRQLRNLTTTGSMCPLGNILC